jgi:hypothetical protein
LCDKVRLVDTSGATTTATVGTVTFSLCRGIDVSGSDVYVADYSAYKVYAFTGAGNGSDTAAPATTAAPTATAETVTTSAPATSAPPTATPQPELTAPPVETGTPGTTGTTAAPARSHASTPAAVLAAIIALGVAMVV